MRHPLHPVRLIPAALLATLLPLSAEAVGGDESAPPEPTPTTTTCGEGRIWNPETQACELPKQGMLSDDALFRTARELAHAGRPEDALTVLALMTEGESDRVLAVKGFALRRAGRVAEGMAAYEAALAKNPDNLLVRSYMGQAFVSAGRLAEAEAELAEIRARGGAGTWAEVALARALATGRTYSY